MHPQWRATLLRRPGRRPLPLIFSVVADVREWWDEAAACFRIDVRVANKLLGPLFGYRSAFTLEERLCAVDDIPADVLPLREEDRE